jgi:hypothetical protein
MKVFSLVIMMLVPTLYSCQNREKLISGNIYEFGAMNKGDSILAKFPIPNKGSKSFKIINITVPCSCTNISYDSTEIKPGNEGVFVVKYNSGNDSGYVSKSFVVETSDSSNRVYTYYLRGTIVVENNKK